MATSPNLKSTVEEFLALTEPAVSKPRTNIPEPVADVHPAVQYATALFNPDDLLCLTFIHGTKKRPNGRFVTENSFVPLSKVITDAGIKRLTARNKDGWQVYVSMAPFKPGSTKRHKPNIASAAHVYAEADANGEAALAAVRESVAAGEIPTPTIIVQSSPHKYHFIWNVTGFTTPAVEAMNRALEKKFNTDAVSDVARVLRIPGFRNIKTKYGESKPMAVIVEFNKPPTAGITINDFKIPLEPERPADWLEPARPRSEDPLAEVIDAIPDETLIGRIRASDQGEKFSNLMAGENPKGYFAASNSLCAILAWWTHNNPERIDRIYKLSGLYADPPTDGGPTGPEWWAESDGGITRGEKTIARSCTLAPIGSMYKPPAGAAQAQVNESAPDPNKTGKKLFLNLAFHSAPVEKIKGREYVLGPNVGEQFGLFRRGQVSLISGSSGGGKTSLINQLLVAQKLGADFLGYKTHGYSFVLLSRDRNQDAHEETMARMHLALETIPFKRLPKNAWDIDAAQAIVNEIKNIHPLPTIVFVEGIDMLLGEPGIKAATYFSGLLEDIAQHFQMTLICSIGSPKTKEGQGYPAGRDNILGSSGWGRTIDTLWWMQFTKDGDTSPQRYLTIYPRNTGAKKFTLEFVEGNLEIRPDLPEDDSRTKNKKTASEIDWYKQQDQLAKTDPTKKWWTVVDAEEALDLKRRTAERHIENHTLKKYLIKKPGEKQGRGTPEQYRWNDSKTNPILAKESQPVELELTF